MKNIEFWISDLNTLKKTIKKDHKERGKDTAKENRERGKMIQKNRLIKETNRETKKNGKKTFCRPSLL